MENKIDRITLRCIVILIVIAIASVLFGSKEINATEEVIEENKEIEEIEEEFVMPEWCNLFLEESYDSEIDGYKAFMELSAEYEELRKEYYKGFDREKRLAANNEIKEQYLSVARELMSRWNFDIEGYDKEHLLAHLEENVRLYGPAFYILKQWKFGELLFREYYEECADIYLSYKFKGTYEPVYFHMMETICPELYTTEIDKWIDAIPDPATDSDGWRKQMNKYRGMYLMGCDIGRVLQYIPDASSKRDEIEEVKKIVHAAWSKATDELIAENKKNESEKKQEDIQNESRSSNSVKTYNVVKYGTRTHDWKFSCRGKCVTPGCIYYTSYGCGSYCEIHYDSKKYGKRGGTPRDWDTYDGHTYSNGEDFADDWEDDFDDWDEAYDYWEDYDN